MYRKWCLLHNSYFSSVSLRNERRLQTNWRHSRFTSVLSLSISCFIAVEVIITRLEPSSLAGLYKSQFVFKRLARFCEPGTRMRTGRRQADADIRIGAGATADVLIHSSLRR